jgi:hypothetical protein
MMNLYLGIKQSDSYLYLAALDNEGVTVFKSRFPSNCPPRPIIDSLLMIQKVFSTPMKIAACFEEANQQSLLPAIQKQFPVVKSFKQSILYSTDLIPDDPYSPHDPYRAPLQLAILTSLDQ